MQKLNDKQRQELVNMLRSGLTVSEVADTYGLLPMHVHNILNCEKRREEDERVAKQIESEKRAASDVKAQKQNKRLETRNLYEQAQLAVVQGERARDVCTRLNIAYNSFHAWRYQQSLKGRDMSYGNLKSRSAKAAKVSERHYQIQMPSRKQSPGCQMCDWLESELRRVESENLNLRIASRRST